MKPISRDITFTLLVKCILLFVLWWVCIKGSEKPIIDARQWLLGHSYTKEQSKPLASDNYQSSHLR